MDDFLKKSMTKKPRALILSGYGINCEVETADCFQKAGAMVDVLHINEAISIKNKLMDYHILVIPGGFSYGDHIKSGKILANKLRFKMGQELRSFIESGRAVLGICNGFQVLVCAGLLPGFSAKNSASDVSDQSFFTPHVSLIANVAHFDHSDFSGLYEDRWVSLVVPKDCRSFWTRGIRSIMLPVRHGEGRLVWDDGEKDIADKIAEKNKQFSQKIMKQASLFYSDSEKNSTMIYPKNPNGSYAAIAGLLNEEGNIFGLMPHPEAYRWKMQAPNYHASKVTNRLCSAENFTDLDGSLLSYLDLEDGYGMTFFYNACHAMRKKFF